jgi:LysM domain
LQAEESARDCPLIADFGADFLMGHGRTGILFQAASTQPHSRINTMAELVDLAAALDDHPAPVRHRPVFGGDLRFGLFLALGLGLTLGLRATGYSAFSQQSATATPAPASTTPTANSAPKLDVKPTMANPSAADSLTRILPKGYRDREQTLTASVSAEEPIADDSPAAERNPKDKQPNERKAEAPGIVVKSVEPAPRAQKPLHPYFLRYRERKEYFVRPGDTWANIARRLYGDESKADALRAANPALGLSDDNLRSGHVLKLP